MVRMDVSDVFHLSNEARAEVPLRLRHFPITCWEAITYRYVSDVMGGVRRLMRIRPDNVRETASRRNASTLEQWAAAVGISDHLGDGPSGWLLASDRHSEIGGQNFQIGAEGVGARSG